MARPIVHRMLDLTSRMYHGRNANADLMTAMILLETSMRHTSDLITVLSQLLLILDGSTVLSSHRCII